MVIYDQNLDSQDAFMCQKWGCSLVTGEGFFFLVNPKYVNESAPHPDIELSHSMTGKSLVFSALL